MDPTFAKSLPFKPHNQTSNQLLVNEQMSIPENKELFIKAVKERKDQGWEAILTRIVCSQALVTDFETNSAMHRASCSAPRISITFKDVSCCKHHHFTHMTQTRLLSMPARMRANSRALESPKIDFASRFLALALP